MDVLNKSCTRYWTNYEYFTGGLALCFNQTTRQKSAKGIVVANPEAAREFALRLLSYADHEQKRYTTLKTVTLEAYEKQMEAKRARARKVGHIKKITKKAGKKSVTRRKSKTKKP